MLPWQESTVQKSFLAVQLFHPNVTFICGNWFEGSTGTKLLKPEYEVVETWYLTKCFEV